MEIEAGEMSPSAGRPQGHFDVGRNIAVVSPFRETEVATSPPLSGWRLHFNGLKRSGPCCYSVG